MSNILGVYFVHLILLPFQEQKIKFKYLIECKLIMIIFGSFILKSFVLNVQLKKFYTHIMDNPKKTPLQKCSKYNQPVTGRRRKGHVYEIYSEAIFLK
jgi:hypothetical protein